MLVQANLIISSALSRFCAQPSRPTTLFCAIKSTYGVVDFSDKRGSKSPKKPQNCSFLLGIAEHSDLRGGSMSPRLFLLQNRASLSARFDCSSLIHFFAKPRNLRYSARLAYLVASSFKSPHKAFLGLTRGYLRQKKRRSRHRQFLSAIPFITSVQHR